MERLHDAVQAQRLLVSGRPPMASHITISSEVIVG